MGHGPSKGSKEGVAPSEGVNSNTPDGRPPGDMVRQNLNDQQKGRKVSDDTKTREIKNGTQEIQKRKRSELRELEKTYKQTERNLNRSPEDEQLSNKLKEIGQQKAEKELEILSHEKQIKQKEADDFDEKYGNTSSKNYNLDKWFSHKVKQAREMDKLEYRENKLRSQLEPKNKMIIE